MQEVMAKRDIPPNGLYTQLDVLEASVARTKDLVAMLHERLTPILFDRSVPSAPSSVDEEIDYPLGKRMRSLDYGLRSINGELQALHELLTI